MDILLTNDDGIQAKGLWALYDRFAPSHRVTVVAPDRERSAIGHAITLHAPIRANMVSMNGAQRAYAVDGTPADCIKLALAELVDQAPDLIISGINPGANVGVNINYSGTLAAAREAALYGIPALAVSIQGKSPAFYDDAAAFVEKLTRQIKGRGLPKGTLLNINVPDLPREKLKGIRLSRQGSEHFKEGLEKRLDPRQRPYYWYGRYVQEPVGDADVDAVALAQDYISLTPLRCDATDYDHLDALRAWDISL
ncbi:MAG: 5'/3'-nucleotidase SurE [Thermodesulfobacteriota bacterium]